MISSVFHTWWQNLLLLIVSFLVMLGIGETVLHVVLSPGDYLVPDMILDEVLSVRVKPLSPGHDAWGYRNQSVPDSVDIVAIGDSQTYGWLAHRDKTWPAYLQQFSGLHVYNMALGGYGPVHYQWLLENQALRLQPRQVIAGFYFGNDVYDAYTLVYSQDYWQSLRRPEVPRQEIVLEVSHFLGGLRTWLSSHSILYRLFVRFVGEKLAFIKMRWFYSPEADVTILDNPTRGVKIGLSPAMWLKALDLKDIRISEGLRLCRDSFLRMDSLCRASGIEFTVLLIPTKETVYAPFLEGGKIFPQTDVLQRMLAAEQQVRDSLVAFLDDNYIHYEDVLPALRKEIGHPGLYTNDQDGHPLAYGYQIIAQAAESALTSKH